eukprot:TRINITY_DN1734_c0_g1_i2.p2 TRINITY_DN1734_c0_g1~~TRINITY_DN1734_c0_g1_i2.p2  ORF type:complete len:106 (+),score=28.46 TRINITY_DN1734_c0_g1_i2:294-611(+)
MSAEQKQYALAKYDSIRTQLRAHLSQTSFTFPRIVGLDWRLDYYIKSNLLDRADEPVYFVSLKVQERDNSIRNVQFSCSLQELQDLHAKLYDACKQLERISHKSE